MNFITLSTPEGNYYLESKNGFGYVYKTSDIAKSKINPNLNDEIKINKKIKYKDTIIF